MSKRAVSSMIVTMTQKMLIFNQQLTTRAIAYLAVVLSVLGSCRVFGTFLRRAGVLALQAF
jgi:hypothetical protein